MSRSDAVGPDDPLHHVVGGLAVVTLASCTLGLFGLLESFAGERRYARAMCAPAALTWLLLGVAVVVPRLIAGEPVAGLCGATGLTAIHLPGLIGAVRAWRPDGA